MQTLRFEQLKGTPEDCYYICEANACVITEDDKAGMVRAGQWRAENPGGGDGKTAGFQLSALYSTIGYTWAEIMADFRKCEGIPDKLQVFTNTVLAEPWDEEAEGADLNAVQKRAEDYAAPAPGWVVVVTCGADVQKDRIEATKWGWGLNEQSGALEHRVFYGDPVKHPEVWEAFDTWRRMEIEHETGLFLPTACTFIDSGDGNRTQAVYDYTRPRRRQGVIACKGSSITGAPLVSRERPAGRNRTPLVMVGASTAKDVIVGRLGIEDPMRPGYIHFPLNEAAGCDKAYFNHLTAEKLVTHRTRGGERAVWEKEPGRRNEALDCAVYALAAKEYTRAPLKHLASRMAAKAAALPPEQRPGTTEYARTKMELALARAIASKVSSPESASTATARRQRRRKVRKLPGAGWIRGN
jgi:phage terminase large subunit GpA-like protein